MPSRGTIPALTLESRLKRRIRRHLFNLGFQRDPDGGLLPPDVDKQAVRHLHRHQRAARLAVNATFVSDAFPRLSDNFADGTDLDPEKMDLRLEIVDAATDQADLFRLSALSWSVPVSNGFGRRLRYLIRDHSNGKIAGIIALGDPVFNLTDRDRWIGWTATERAHRLVNVLDAYVVGAIPPYNLLLVGKLIACLLRSRDIYNDFHSKYGHSAGVISKTHKHPELLLITTSSALGRSSVYSRLRLSNVEHLIPIGYTHGWGHFHLSDELFEELRTLLRSRNHPYADNHRFGQGPNWRLRTIREGMKALGFPETLLKHGVKRQVFAATLAVNTIDILRSGAGTPDTSNLMSVKDIAQAAAERWVLPRARRRTEFRQWTRRQFGRLISIDPRDGIAHFDSAGDSDFNSLPAKLEK